MIVKQFKLYPDCHWLFFDVLIHHTRDAMMKACSDLAPDFDGICRSWVSIYEKREENGLNFISQPKIGEIHLFKARASVGVTTHEVCHAVHHYFWIRRRCNAGPVMRNYRGGLRDSQPKEESFCWVMGEMFRQFCVNFHGRKQVKPPKQKVIFPVKKGTRIKPTKKALRQG